MFRNFRENEIMLRYNCEEIDGIENICFFTLALPSMRNEGIPQLSCRTSFFSQT